ncbi:LuxR C-terminal-related transcriptional regulator [Saccharopolyspora sp. NPDC050389]|uniref:LuxR C-terminal-related transcriptional regulator n=1 Tax=Saccharopolyspora sp. NPDC050389 TaxID=3155516 RepID=UPI0033CD0E95
MAQGVRQQASGLPHELTSFVGRRQAMADVKRALSDSRLVTLTGFGGMGKSRLALHVAHALRRAFTDGAHLVELADVQDPSLVPHAVIGALGLQDRSMRDLDTVLTEYLVDRHLLLVLDNCEHLLGSCGHLITTLLSAAPRLRVLATSREPIGIRGEQILPVPPLSLPTADDSKATDETPPRNHAALRLFEDRAAAVSTGFSLTEDNEIAVARLCQRLDGVPLAIELAAVRVRVLSVEEILDRLESRFQLLTSRHLADAPRHQSLRAAVDWSFDLCTHQERQLWARCSVFAGDFDLDAAEHICADDGLTTDDVFTGIAGLIDKSILASVGQHPRSRYRMLETIRQYGQEQLSAAGEESSLRRRHRDYYLVLAEQSDGGSAGPSQADWVKRLRIERPNFWAALEYCLTTSGEARTALRMTAALWFLWLGFGFTREGRRWLDRALDADTGPSTERARALWIDGWLAHLHGDRTGSLSLLNESRALAQQLGNETELTYALQFLGDTEMWDHNLSRAGPLLDQALTRHRASAHWTAPALIVFALQAQRAGLHGDVDRAMEFLHECESVCAQLGERWALSWTEWNVGVSWWAAGNATETALHVSASLRAKQDLEDTLGIACCVELLTWVAAIQGNTERAAVLFGALGRLWAVIGTPLFGAETLLSWRAQAQEQVRERLGDTAFEAAGQKGALMDQEETISYALGETTTPALTHKARQVPLAESPLTKREREVASLIASGKSNKEIAANLVIARRTAETHVEHILVKLGFTSRMQIATWVTDHTQK